MSFFWWQFQEVKYHTIIQSSSLFFHQLSWRSHFFGMHEFPESYWPGILSKNSLLGERFILFEYYEILIMFEDQNYIFWTHFSRRKLDISEWCFKMLGKIISFKSNYSSLKEVEDNSPVTYLIPELFNIMAYLWWWQPDVLLARLILSCKNFPVIKKISWSKLLELVKIRVMP